MSSIMDLIGPELCELSAIFDFVYTLASANIDQSVPNLATIYLLIRSRMSLITEQIKPEHPELFALEFGKIAENDFVFTLASTNVDQYWSTKYGHNIYDTEILDEFDYGSNPTVTSGLIYP